MDDDGKTNSAMFSTYSRLRRSAIGALAKRETTCRSRAHGPNMLLISALLCGCSSLVSVQGGASGSKIDVPVDGAFDKIVVTLAQDKCTFSLKLSDIYIPPGAKHYWILTGQDPLKPLPVTFDDNGIDIWQDKPVLPLEKMDFIKGEYSPSRKSYDWTANPNYSTGFRRSYTINIHWNKPDFAPIPCTGVDPIIVNRNS